MSTERLPTLKETTETIAEKMVGQVTPWDQNEWESFIEEYIHNRNVRPKKLHEKWLLKMHEDGWTFGSSLSLSKKTNPLFVDFEELPEERVKFYENLLVLIKELLSHINDEHLRTWINRTTYLDNKF